ncbi:MAG: hypothetical protein QGI83_11200 [Candidatus Latescibacteria bacterium]|jgi:hypothetical protein|nr:hypothetical protein [Candidatus Latescibacterota bacterium]
MSHQSCFTFRTHGGVCAGEQWIYDGEEPVARLESCTVEQPEENLRYFDGNPKPVNLRDLKLAPGGRPLVCGVQMYWVFQHRALATTELQSVTVDGDGTDCLSLTVVTRDPGGVATSRRALSLTYDPDLASYVYDFKAHLEIHSPEVFDKEEDIRFEYCDPWYNDVPGPTVEFPGMWRKRYSHLLAEKGDGETWQMPLNHMATGIPSPRSLKRDGLFVLAHDPGNNPAFEFVGDTADRTSIGVCNWGYDIHFAGHYERDELYGPICPHFRIRLCPDEKASQMQAEAAPVPPVAYNGFEELPLYERSTSFANGLRLNEPTPGATDPWPWLPEGDGAEWCRDEGRSDSCSLKISKDTTVPTEWVMNRESEGAWTQRWTASTSFRVTAYIKTDVVAGRGAFLAVRWGVYNYPERYPYICSEKLTGTHDWTRVSVEIHGPPPPDISAVHLIFRQDGPGTSWLDDLDVEVV